MASHGINRAYGGVAEKLTPVSMINGENKTEESAATDTGSYYGYCKLFKTFTCQAICEGNAHALFVRESKLVYNLKTHEYYVSIF